MSTAGHVWTPAQRRNFAKTMKAKKAARLAAGQPDGWTPKQRADFDKAIQQRKGKRAAAEAAGVAEPEANGTRKGPRPGYKQSPEHRRNITMAKKEAAAVRTMQGLVERHNGNGALHHNEITTEVKVGSEIAFSFGSVRVVVRAVA